MNKRRGTHTNLISISSVKTERYLQAIETMEQLEDIQGVNDDVLDLLASCNKTIENTMERIIAQNDAIDSLIERIIKGGAAL